MKRLLCAAVAAVSAIVFCAGSAEARPRPSSWQMRVLGGEGTLFYAVNDNGDAVGASGFFAGPLISYAGAPATVVTRPGWTGGLFNDINASGVAVGAASTAAGRFGIVYDHGAVTELPVDELLNGINDAGVVGGAKNMLPYIQAPGGPITYLPTGGFPEGAVMDVANGNWAVGFLQNPSTSEGAAAVWNPAGELTLVPVPGGGLGYKINSSGTAVGIARDAGWIWSASTSTLTFPAVPGYPNSAAIGITDDGTIAGWLGYSGPNFVADAAGMTHVEPNTRPTPVKFILNGISNSGIIVGAEMTTSQRTGESEIRAVALFPQGARPAPAKGRR